MRASSFSLPPRNDRGGFCGGLALTGISRVYILGDNKEVLLCLYR